MRHREDPQDGAGWGSPIYVPAEEMVLHEHVLHPFLQWLLLLLLQDDTETRVSAPHPEKGRSCLWAEPKHAEASGQSSFLHFPPLRSWHTERPCGLESTGEREPAISICPSWAGQAAPSASTATQLLLHSLPWQGKQPHPQPLELAPEETEDGLKHKAGRGRQ